MANLLSLANEITNSETLGKPPGALKNVIYSKFGHKFRLKLKTRGNHDSRINREKIIFCNLFKYFLKNLLK